MKKVVRLIVCGFLILFLVGCDKKENKVSFLKYYNDLQISNNMNGYSASISVKIDDTKDNINIVNYMNSKIKITKLNTKIVGEKIIFDNKDLYYISNKYYLLENNNLVETTETSDYLNTNVFVKPLENAKGIYLKDIILGTNTYKLYSFNIKKEDMDIIISNTSVKEFDDYSSIEAISYINSNDKLYRIDYNLKRGSSTANKISISFKYMSNEELLKQLK